MSFDPTRINSPWDWLSRVFTYTPKRMPSPGANNFALLPAYSLPGNSVAGPGTIFGGGSSPLPVINSTPQMVFVQAQVASGVEGTSFGGIQPQGLVDMDKLVKAQAA